MQPEFQITAMHKPAICLYPGPDYSIARPPILFHNELF